MESVPPKPKATRPASPKKNQLAAKKTGQTKTAAKTTTKAKTYPARVPKRATPRAKPQVVLRPVAVSVRGLSKSFASREVVKNLDITVLSGGFYGIVGPNGAGKTTILSMLTGLLRPDQGTVLVNGVDVWKNGALAKKTIGVLPDRFRLFDRLTGAEFLYHAGALHGLGRRDILQRMVDLAERFGLEHSLHRMISDYSVGMTKKIAIAAALMHSPRLLVLDEPFESVDPVSIELVIQVLTRFTELGGTVILSSHSMELTQRVCDQAAIIADGKVLVEGTMAEVVAGGSLQDRFVELAGGSSAVKEMEWLQNFSG